jgi:hypothetical protein
MQSACNAAMNTHPTARIRLIRHGGYVDMFRSYRIYADGQERGRIGRNSVLELEVPSGSVTLEARLDWCRSQPLKIVAPAGQTVAIEAVNNWGPLLALWGVTFGCRSYLKLEPASGKLERLPFSLNRSRPSAVIPGPPRKRPDRA